MQDKFDTATGVNEWEAWAREDATKYITGGCAKTLGEFIGNGYLEARHHIGDIAPFILSGTGIEGKDIVDYGCGLGRMSLWFHVFGARVVGVDASQAMIRQAAELFPGPVYVVGDGKSIPMSNESADIIFSTIVFQHMPTDAVAAVLKDGLRVLRPGGFLAFQLPTCEADEGREWAANPCEVSRWSRQELTDALAGYEIERLPINNHWELHIARKVA